MRRSAPLSALGIRGKEAVRSIGAQLCGDVQPHSPLVERHWPRCDIPKHPVNCRSHRAEEYNQRKGRQGAFWKDRYHATAIEADEHLHRCLAYIDLNMVRAGVVNHPAKWEYSGYREIQAPPERYAVIDLPELTRLCGFVELGDFQRAHHQWVEQALENGRALRDDRWSEAIAVGSLAFVEMVRNDLGVKATHREVLPADGTYALREASEPYLRKSTGKIEVLRAENTFFWDETVENAAT